MSRASAFDFERNTCSDWDTFIMNVGHFCSKLLLGLCLCQKKRTIYCTFKYVISKMKTSPRPLLRYTSVISSPACYATNFGCGPGRGYGGSFLWSNVETEKCVPSVQQLPLWTCCMMFLAGQISRNGISSVPSSISRVVAIVITYCIYNFPC